MAFKTATKKQARARIGLEGPAGSGKTYTGLMLATALGTRVGVLDSEHGSASKYSGIFKFDVDEDFESYAIETYIAKIKAAAAAGYDALLIDSLSHAWAGKGGALEQVDRLGAANPKGNKFTSGWSHVTPLQTRMIEEILAYPGHVIVTMRTKTEYVLEDRGGKQVPKKVGMAPIQRDGVDYELDVVAEMDLNGHVSITKTRCPDLKGSAGLLTYEDVPKLAAKIKAWLEDGAPVPETPMERLKKWVASRPEVGDNWKQVQAIKGKKPSELTMADVEAVFAAFPAPPPPPPSDADAPPAGGGQ